MADKRSETDLFYGLLDRLASRTGGPLQLTDCHGRMDWPERGVYFFFQNDEQRSASGEGARVVRIGTHTLRPVSKSTLWGRLSQHRGPARHLRGNHRGSIFRLLVGTALTRRDGVPLPTSWGVAASRSAAARRLGLSTAAVRDAEVELEMRVSEYIGQMPFLWLNVDDPPGRLSNRGFIERNAIALLSGSVTPTTDPPTPQWLGYSNDRERVRRSGLWNNEHVDESYHPSFLIELERKIESTQGI